MRQFKQKVFKANFDLLEWIKDIGALILLYFLLVSAGFISEFSVDIEEGLLFKKY